MTQIQIFPLTAAHVPAIAALEQVCFPDPWTEAAIASELDNELSLWLVAACGDDVIGYIGSQIVPDEADVMNLAVAPEWRRQGLGKRLLDALQTQLRLRGVHSLTLEVRSSNEPAIRLYQQMGFSQVGLRKNYYQNPREDARILRKEWSL